MTNPFDFSATDTQDQPSQYNPFDYPVDSIVPLNGKAEPEEPMPEWGGKFPTAYASAKTAQDGLEFGLSMLPYGKYLIPAEQEKFMKLSQGEQSVALLWEAANATIFAGAPLIGKGIGRGVKGLFGLFKRSPKVLSSSEALVRLGEIAPKFKAEPFIYQDELMKTFQGSLGMKAEEALEVASAMGREGGLLGQSLRGIKNTKPFEEATEWVKGGAYPMKKLRDGFAKRYDEVLMRAKFNNKQFEKAARKELFGRRTAEKVEPMTTQALFQDQLRKVYPDMPKSTGFGDLGEEEMRNLVLNMLSHKAVSRQVVEPGIGKIMPMNLTPWRIVFGTGEAGLGTYSRIYRRTKDLVAEKDKIYFNSIRKWAGMGEEAKLWRVSDKPTGFKLKDIVLKAEEQNLAYDVILKTDSLAGQIRRLDPVKNAELFGELTQAKVTNEARLTFGTNAWKLRHMWQGYSDELYGEYMIEQIPRVFRKARITAGGATAVEKLMAV